MTAPALPRQWQSLAVALRRRMAGAGWAYATDLTGHEEWTEPAIAAGATEPRRVAVDEIPGQVGGRVIAACNGHETPSPTRTDPCHETV